MTEQQIAAVKQALAWIEANADTQDEWDMVADLRQALEQQPVQVTVKDFVTAVQGKEHLNGKPMYWAQWPNENAIANEALDKMAENARELGLDYDEGWKDGYKHGAWADKPAAQWAGLTDEEMHACWDSPLTPLGMKYARAIEAKLREKNSGSNQ